MHNISYDENSTAPQTTVQRRGPPKQFLLKDLQDYVSEAEVEDSISVRNKEQNLHEDPQRGGSQ